MSLILKTNLITDYQVNQSLVSVIGLKIGLFAISLSDLSLPTFSFVFFTSFQAYSSFSSSLFLFSSLLFTRHSVFSSVSSASISPSLTTIQIGIYPFSLLSSISSSGVSSFEAQDKSSLAFSWLFSTLFSASSSPLSVFSSTLSVDSQI